MGAGVRHAWAAVVIAVVGLALSSPATSAAARWPVIGCSNLRYNFFNHYAWKHAPSGLCVITPTNAGIDHVKWTGWGGNKATGKGDFIDSLGYMYPATITAYDLYVTHNFLGRTGSYAAWYGKLHVVAKRQFRGGIYRGPFNVVLNVTPEE